MAAQFTVQTGALTSGFTASTARTVIEGTATANTPLEWIELAVGNMVATGFTVIEFCTYTASGTGTSHTPKRVGQGVGTAVSAWEINSTVEPSSPTVVWAEVFANPFSYHIQWPLGREVAHSVSIIQGVRLTTSVVPDSTHPIYASLIIEE